MRTKMKCTPGPWAASSYAIAGYGVFTKDGKRIANCGTDSPVSKWNAHVMAAGLDAYAILSVISEWLESGNMPDPYTLFGEDPDDDVTTIKDAVRAYIKKVEGS